MHASKMRKQQSEKACAFPVCRNARGIYCNGSVTVTFPMHVTLISTARRVVYDSYVRILHIRTEIKHGFNMVTGHSFLSAITGCSEAARGDGYYPERIPMQAQNVSANTGRYKGMLTTEAIVLVVPLDEAWLSR
jgi:hypothetical protein